MNLSLTSQASTFTTGVSLTLLPWSEKSAGWNGIRSLGKCFTENCLTSSNDQHCDHSTAGGCSAVKKDWGDSLHSFPTHYSVGGKGKLPLTLKMNKGFSHRSPETHKDHGRPAGGMTHLCPNSRVHWSPLALTGFPQVGSALGRRGS